MKGLAGQVYKLNRKDNMQILKQKLLSSGYGTHKYLVEWLGECTKEELINTVDGSSGNYGGYVEVSSQKGQHYKGIVGVYYD